MTRFIDITYPAHHHGAERVESAIETAQKVRLDFSGAHGLATLLLSAITAAIMVVAYQVMDSVAEGHLLAMWMALWIVAFVALALFAGATRQLAARAKSGLDASSLHRAQARADQRLWAMALRDSRLMSELQVAMTRGEEDAEAATPAMLARAARARSAVMAGASAGPGLSAASLL